MQTKAGSMNHVESFNKKIKIKDKKLTTKTMENTGSQNRTKSPGNNNNRAREDK